MKRKIFSPKLYIEGLKQLRLVGIMTAVIICIQALLIPIGRVIEYTVYSQTENNPLGFIEINPLLITMIYLIAPMMVLVLFGFMNKRCASDFYHSISETRTSLFISFFAAVLTWIISICVISTLLGTVLHACFPKYFVINYVNVLLSLLNIIIGSVYSAAAVLLCMTVTGTLLTNVVVSGMLLLIPRIFIIFAVSAVTDNLPIVANTNFLPLLSKDYNLFTGLLYGSLDVYYPSNTIYLTNINSGIFTFILTVVFFVAALVLFRRRKSESAGNAAINKFLQAIFRIIPCMLICVIVCSYIFSLYIKRTAIDASEVFLIFVLYVVAVVVYFLYELITTRKFKNLLKAIPTLGVVAVLNLVCIAGMIGVYNATLNYAPEADEISYIRILSPVNSSSSDMAYYFNEKASSIKLYDKTLNSIVAKTLKSEIDSIKTNTYYDRYRVDDSYSTKPAYDSETEMVIAIKSKGGERYRMLRISSADIETISSRLEANEEYQRIYTTLPDSNSPKTVISSYGNLTDEDLEKVYNVLRLEVAKIDFSEWYLMVQEPYMYSNLDTIYLTTMEGSESYTVSIPIFTQCKEACKEYLDQIDYTVNSKELLELLDDPESIEYIDLEYYNVSYQDGLSFSFSGQELVESPQICNKITENITDSNIIDLDKPFMKISVMVIYDEIGENYYEHQSYYSYASDKVPDFYG